MMSVHPPAGVAGPAFSILDVMRYPNLLPVISEGTSVKLACKLHTTRSLLQSCFTWPLCEECEVAINYHINIAFSWIELE